jgi:hypothetical protein
VVRRGERSPQHPEDGGVAATQPDSQAFAPSVRRSRTYVLSYANACSTWRSGVPLTRWIFGVSSILRILGGQLTLELSCKRTK